MATNHFLENIVGYEDHNFRSGIPDALRLTTDSKPVVSVMIPAYNQEWCIRQCIEGVLAQQVDFDYEIIITDDASDDSTPAIIREYAERYPTIIRPILGKLNFYTHNRKRIFEQFLPLARGKYICFCEGDDYWTYEYKMQRMYEYMEVHPAHSMCFHAFEGLNELSDTPLLYPRLPRPRDVGRFELIVEPYIQFATFMARKEPLMQDSDLDHDYIAYTQGLDSTLRFCDMRIYLALMHAGKVHGFTDSWSVYRVHSGGVYTSQVLAAQAHADTLTRLESLERSYNGHYRGLRRQKEEFIDMNDRLIRWTHARRGGKYAKALRWLLSAMWHHPRMFAYTYFHRYVW